MMMNKYVQINTAVGHQPITWTLTDTRSPHLIHTNTIPSFLRPIRVFRKVRSSGERPPIAQYPAAALRNAAPLRHKGECCVGTALGHKQGPVFPGGQCAAAELNPPIAPPPGRVGATMEEYHRHCDEVLPLGRLRATPAPARLGTGSRPAGLQAPGGPKSLGAASSEVGSFPPPQGSAPPIPVPSPRSPEGGLRIRVAGVAGSAWGGRWGRGRGAEGLTPDAGSGDGMADATGLQGRPWKPVFLAISSVLWRSQGRCPLPASEALVPEPLQFPDILA